MKKKIMSALIISACVFLASCQMIPNGNGESNSQNTSKTAPSVSVGDDSAATADVNSEINTEEKDPNAYSDADIDTDSDAYCVINENGDVLLSKNAMNTMAPASITKVMTALVVVKNTSLDKVVPVSQNAVDNINLISSGVAPSLKCGEEMTIRDLLYALLLPSTNAAGNVLAEGAAGSIENFVEMMNEEKDALGCVNSHFMNPHGLDQEDHYVCAYDMCLILKAAMAEPELAKILGTKEYQIPETTMSPARSMAMGHQMVTGAYYYPEVIGGKTGWTVNAQSTLVTAAKIKESNYYVCTLHADEGGAYNDTRNLLESCKKSSAKMIPQVNNMEVTNVSDEGVDVAWDVNNTATYARIVYWDLSIGTSNAVSYEMKSQISNHMTYHVPVKKNSMYAFQVFLSNDEDPENVAGGTILNFGKMLSEGIHSYDGKEYYIQQNGFLASSWIETSEGAYFGNNKGEIQYGLLQGGKASYYLGEDGHPQKGWITINGRMYYFQADGRMATGKMIIDGVEYDLGSDGSRKQ